MEQRRVIVVADSSISLPQEVVKPYPLVIVPLEVNFEDRVYRDGVDVDPSTFYQWLRDSPRLPTTSAPRPASFLEAFRHAAEQGQEVLCLTITANLSATYQSACSAAEMAREQLPGVAIRIVDTNTAAAAEGLVALAAARAASAGLDQEGVARAAQRVISRVRFAGFLDTLYYLGKGGRIPKVAAWIGNLLSIKPLLELADGRVHLLERPRTKKKALQRLLAIMRRHLGSNPARIIVAHAAAPEEAESLREQVAKEFHCQELFVSEFTPVIGAHTGPGLLGCAFYPEGEEVQAN